MTNKLTLMPKSHPGEDVFESYVFDRLSDSETADFEEHLLLCELCQSKLAQAEEYVGLMKAATSEYVTEHRAKVQCICSPPATHGPTALSGRQCYLETRYTRSPSVREDDSTRRSPSS
jgi:hypothetical protein